MGKTNKWNLISAFVEVWKKANGSELSETFYEESKAPMAYLKKKLDITPFQCFALSVMLDNDGPIALKNIGAYAKVSNIEMIAHQADIDELLKRKMITRDVYTRRGDTNVGYSLSKEMMKAVQENETFVPMNLLTLNAADILDMIGHWLAECDRDNERYPMMVEDIKGLLSETVHTEFAKQLNALSLKDEDLVLFLIAAYMQAIRGTAAVIEPHYIDILGGMRRTHVYLRTISNGTNILYKLGLIEQENSDGMSMPGRFVLTQKAKETILSELEFRKREEGDTNVALLKPEEVVEKQLYYNQRENEQVKRLADLLSPENFKGVQSRLVEAHLRPGFACLLYGAPGTGKTETVLQLCKQTGRPVMEVNVADMKSKWVGESEKNIQLLFDSYRALVRKSSLCPILLFNEADAIIGRRQVGAERAVEKMENSIQNIILQEMEKLEGILIATTNLTQNLDPAFERRFLYKIRFEKPSVEVKSKIWRSMLPDLPESEADVLATDYDFSGGQIENIARKQTVDYILYANPVSLEHIRSLCDEENIQTGVVRKERTPIGFAC